MGDRRVQGPARGTATALGLWLGWLVLAGGCGDEDPGPPPVFTLEEVERDFVEVVECRPSHEHDLNHVRVFADPEAAEIFVRCVLTGLGGRCDVDRFDTGARFVKYEYQFADCEPDDLVSYTTSLRLEDGAYPEGLDWHWQRLTPAMEVVEDGAPDRCLQCHINHCREPYGLDLRCLPD